MAFDALDADWEGLRGSSTFSLDLEAHPFQAESYWAARFGRPAGVRFESPFRDMPFFRIELTLERHHPWVPALLDQESGWFDIELAGTGELPVDVYGGLFMPPVEAMIVRQPAKSRRAARLSHVFSMKTWPDAPAGALASALKQSCPLEALLVHDIGQGSACSLICKCGFAHLHFDAGCGVYRNEKTNPGTIQFCQCIEAPVILSHWDSDHWAGAALDTGMLRRTWIAPRQEISFKHLAFADDILEAGGQILVFPRKFPLLAFGTYQRLTLLQCTGPVTDRNSSGLALTVEDPHSGGAWLLTGDAGYNYIPAPRPKDYTAVVVPHHGADMGSASKPPAPVPGQYARLLYSFGPGNAHGKTAVRHPTLAAVSAHEGKGWSHGNWATAAGGPGFTEPGHPVLATATHLTTHDDGALVGWSTAPPIPAHLASCKWQMPVTQT